MSSVGRRPAIPVALGIGMLVVVIAAGLSPNPGAVKADTNCAYGVCQNTAPQSLLPFEIVLVVLIIAAIGFALLLWMRRRRRPPEGGPVEPWTGAAVPPGTPAEEAMIPPAAAMAPAAPAAYVETLEDIGLPPPAAPEPAPPGPAPPAEGAPEADIDSLMKELDKISNEILKRGAPKKPPTSESDEGNGGGGGGQA